LRGGAPSIKRCGRCLSANSCLIELRFGFDGEQHSLATAGRKLGITRERARQLEREALTKLASALSTAAVGETIGESAGLPSAA
jgi:hypothetical protein